MSAGVDLSSSVDGYTESDEWWWCIELEWGWTMMIATAPAEKQLNRLVNSQAWRNCERVRRGTHPTALSVQVPRSVNLAGC
jgi:hypothetical protein